MCERRAATGARSKRETHEILFAFAIGFELGAEERVMQRRVTLVLSGSGVRGRTQESVGDAGHEEKAHFAGRRLT